MSDDARTGRRTTAAATATDWERRRAVKKLYLAFVALVLIGIGVSVLLPKVHEKWTLQPGKGNELILSLKGESANVQSPRLEIRCDAGKSEVRDPVQFARWA